MALNAGAIRFNTDRSQMEIYDGNQWTGILSTSPDMQTGGTRGMMLAGGYEPGFSNRIQFHTFANRSTAHNGTTDFGDLTTGAFNPACMSNNTRGIITSMEASGSPIAQLNNLIDFITIASTGDAVDFGDLTYGQNRHGCGTSNGHGGL